MVKRLPVLLPFLACALAAQELPPAEPVFKPAPIPPACNSYTMNHEPGLSAHQKLCYFADHRLVSFSGLTGAAFFSMTSQLLEKPDDRSKGLGGFGERFGARYAQATAKSLAATIVEIVNHEDPRTHPPRPGPLAACASTRADRSAQTDVEIIYSAFLPCTKTEGAWKRTGQALLRTVWVEGDPWVEGDRRRDANAKYTRRGHRVALSNIAGAFASGFVGAAFYPDRLNTPGRSLRRTGSAFGGTIANSLFTEFSPDVLKVFNRLFGGNRRENH